MDFCFQTVLKVQAIHYNDCGLLEANHPTCLKSYWKMRWSPCYTETDYCFVSSFVKGTHPS